MIKNEEKVMKITLIISIIIVTILFGIIMFMRLKLKERVEIKVDYIMVIEKAPLFEKDTFKSKLVTTIKNEEVEVLEDKPGWTKVKSSKGEYWLPSMEKNYDFNNEVKMDIKNLKQFPELENGCESVALQMMLTKYELVGTDIVSFSEELPLDTTKKVQHGDEIKVWGDPNVGFVGDMTGEKMGYSIYSKPLVKFLEENYLERPVDLTGVKPEILERYIRSGNPVVVWVTVNFRERESEVDWVTEDGKEIASSFNIHAMTMVGFNEEFYYFNDPYTGIKNLRVTKEKFEKVWNSMGKMALSAE